MKIVTKSWFKAAGIRALKTLAQTAVATIGTTAVISQVDWIVVASASALAAVLSMLTSIAGLPEVSEEQQVSNPQIALQSANGQAPRKNPRGYCVRHRFSFPYADAYLSNH